MRIIHFLGGNAAGKSTLVDDLQQRWKHLENIAWLHGDGGLFGGDVRDQFKTLMRFWSDPLFETIVLQGTRVYSTVFRCSTNARVPRDIYLGLMLQDYETGIQHLKMRCARRGKVYRDDFWGRGDEEVGHLFHDRYIKGVAKFQREHSHVPVRSAEQFWIDAEYRTVADIRLWAGWALGDPLSVKIWETVDRSGDCWPWPQLMTNGYGYFSRNAYAHRMAWEAVYGPPGETHVLHRCDNPPCCRPSHLFNGTQADNVKDMWEKGRAVMPQDLGIPAPQGFQLPQTKLSDAQVLEIRQRAAAGEKYKALGRHFGIHRSHARQIALGLEPRRSI